MSALVDRALEATGLFDLLHARERGDFAALREATARLRDADLLVLGALADRIRKREVGDEVRVHLGEPRDAAGEGAFDLVVVAPAEGLAFLRAVAIARVTGPRAARVRIDWNASGMELSQVALGFGASEIVAQLTLKRGLPIADDKLLGVGKKSNLEPAAVVKKRELTELIERGGRRASFVEARHEATFAGESA